VTDESIEAPKMSDNDAILAANAAYYQAFSTGDFSAMARVWAEDGVSCVHPGWPPLIGRDDVIESYRGILASQNRVRIAHQDDVALVAGDEARVLCIEIVGGAALAATNVYRRLGGEWRMVHHQASPIALADEDDDEAPPSNRLN
jgi:ketosteroid isomerase-like protein